MRVHPIGIDAALLEREPIEVDRLLVIAPAQIRIGGLRRELAVRLRLRLGGERRQRFVAREHILRGLGERRRIGAGCDLRSEEHTPELQSLMRISYAVFCLKKKQDTTYKLSTLIPILCSLAYTTHT